MEREILRLHSVVGDRMSAVELRGLGSALAFPAGIYTAPEGFGESHWLDAIPVGMISYRFSGAAVTRQRGRFQVGSGPRNNLAVTPKGTANDYVSRGPIRFGQIFLPDALLDKVATAADSPELSARLRDDLVFPGEPRLESLVAVYLHRAFDTREPATQLELEGRTLLLLDELLRLHAPRPPVRARGGLSGPQLRRVREMIASRLDGAISLVELAAAVSLSTKHFARAFREATGTPPHRWITEQRVERAQAMLADGNLSLTQIALACGFADQSHFTATFRRVTGTTPARYRQQVRL